MKISISYENSCVLYLTDTNWDKYKEEEKIYNNLLFIGPVTIVEDNWLYGCTSLVNVDFRGLNNLRAVDNYWLSYCFSLVNIDFTGLNQLISVGDNWLYMSSVLLNVDFRGLNNLKEVGSYWLDNCFILVNIDFTGLTVLQEVGNNWLYGCKNLVSVNFTELISLEKVGSLFLAEIDLENVYLIGLNNTFRKQLGLPPNTSSFNFKKKSSIKRKSSKKKSPIRRKSSKKSLLLEESQVKNKLYRFKLINLSYVYAFFFYIRDKYKKTF